MKNYKTPLNEITRWEIIKKSQQQSPERFNKKQFFILYHLKLLTKILFSSLAQTTKNLVLNDFKTTKNLVVRVKKLLKTSF